MENRQPFPEGLAQAIKGRVIQHAEGGKAFRQVTQSRQVVFRCGVQVREKGLFQRGGRGLRIEDLFNPPHLRGEGGFHALEFGGHP